MTKKICVSASTHACPYKNLPEYIQKLHQARCDFLHVDLMDGKFVEDSALSIEQILEIGSISVIPLDIHLMAVNPKSYIDACLEADAEFVTVHYESFDNDEDLIDILFDLKTNGIKAGISLCPDTPNEVLIPFLEFVDLVLVMSVVPGKSGQSFMLQCLDKIKFFDEQRKENGLSFLIEVDGGINQTTAPLTVSMGANMLVSGSYLYKASSLENAILDLKKSKN